MTQVLTGKVVGFAGKYRLHIYFSLRMHMVPLLSLAGYYHHSRKFLLVLFSGIHCYRNKMIYSKS